MKYVAFLRGINVGGNKKVEMKKLKSVFEFAGYTNVSTYINSGNAIFETHAGVPKGEDIEKLLKKHFSFDIWVLVRDAKNIKKIIEVIPKEWGNDTEQKTDALFLWDEFDNKKTLGLIKVNAGVDTLMYVPGAIIWNVQRKDYSKSGMNKFVGTVVYKHMTARNVNTVRKLGEMMG